MAFVLCCSLLAVAISGFLHMRRPDLSVFGTERLEARFSSQPPRMNFVQGSGLVVLGLAVTLFSYSIEGRHGYFHIAIGAITVGVLQTAYGLIHLVRETVQRRIPPHCCQSCGYDLTGNTSGTCPECGEEI
jgi:hypothetical protein